MTKFYNRPIGKNLSRLTAVYHALSTLPTVRGAGGERQECDLVVSEQFNWVYIGIPLTGTRSILSALRKSPEINVLQLKANPHVYLANRTNNNLKAFSIVRNPWSRVVSCYNKKILNANSLAKLYFLSRYRGLRPMMSFDDFVSWLVSDEGSDDKADPHWLSQWQFLYKEDGIALYDYLGNLETLTEDITQIFNETSTPVPEIPRRRASTDMPVQPLHSSYREYYTDATKEMVEQRYAKDLELFSYTF